MSYETLLYLKNKPLLIKYLRENSYWYKYLNRGSDIKTMENEMLDKYKLTFNDKFERFKNNLIMIKTFIDILK